MEKILQSNCDFIKCGTEGKKVVAQQPPIPPSLWTDVDLKGFIINPSWESSINGPHKIILTILSDGKKVLIRKY